MRQYKTLLKGLLADQVKHYRASKNITQEEMAENLHISTRSYSDLERDVFCFSAVTLMFFLLALPEKDVTGLLQDFRVLVDQEEQT